MRGMESMSFLATASTQKMAGHLLWLALLLCCLSESEGQLHVKEDKICGETKCPANSYCRTRDQYCSPCAEICDAAKDHFDEGTCDRLCQDYLHDLRYSRLGAPTSPSSSADLEGQVRSLRILATASIVISVILAVIVLGIFLIWAKKKNILPFSLSKGKQTEKGRYPGDTPISTIRLPKSTTVTIPAISEAVRNNNPLPPPTEYSTNLTTFKNPAPKKPEGDKQASAAIRPKALERRVPSEDSALDFAYDNPAMSPSPVPSKAESP